MAEYRVTLGKRRIWMIISGLVVLTIGVILTVGFFSSDNGGGFTDGFFDGMQVGWLFGMAAVMAGMTVRYSRALHNDALLQKFYIQETDERNRMIRDKIGGLGMNLAIGMLALGALIAGSFDRTVFITLMCATLGVLLLRIGLKLYFYHKY